ncbi:COP9 signalosome (CSN) subunit [Maudiozyma exigua]|uniref:COP9 signalosome (CSN) subunit n=1 Tax=Maudiozyma exigua TaxID=34358 RepID=A0A9P6W661_MAUEX|nr:COP9 signalosome (CSN) subunit [Kazachstania exigua]
MANEDFTMNEMKSIVDFGDYFRDKYSDDSLVRYFQYHLRKESTTLYMLNNEFQDDKIKQVFELNQRIWSNITTFHSVPERGKKMALQYHKELFDMIDEQLLLMNRIAERESRWILYPLFVLARELVMLVKELRKHLSFNLTTYVERCGRSVHRSFTLCLNDRNPNKLENRRSGVYLFINLEFKIYHKLNNRDMIKNLVKVVKSRQEDRFEPLMSCHESLCSIYNSQEVTYNYYMGQYYGCIENNYEKAFEYLNLAYLGCNDGYKSQLNKILILLIPFGLLSHRKLVHQGLLSKLYGGKKLKSNVNQDNIYENDERMLGQLYKEIIKCCRTGNIVRYDNLVTITKSNQIFFLRNGLYVSMQLLRELVLLRYVEIIYQLNEKMTIIPLEMIYIAKFYGQKKKVTITTEAINELECELACLISKKMIKGYLSHGNKCMVVSKTDPFPNLKIVK